VLASQKAPRVVVTWGWGSDQSWPLIETFSTNTVISGKINFREEDNCQNNQRKTYLVEVQQLEA
jgi:hypothetical protein